jgi:NDP-sugar pyrophosphorylase family protein
VSQLPPAVILAAGESSRFWPLSTHGHKSLHRLCGKAIIEHTVASLAVAGVRDLVIVQSPVNRTADFPHRSVSDQLGDGSHYGVKITYLDQPEPLGPGDAIRRAAGVAGDEFFVVQPENINAGKIIAELVPVDGTVLSLKRQRETWIYGVCAVDGDRVTKMVEKPPRGTEPSDLCNMGLFKVNAAYVKALREVEPSHTDNVTALHQLAQAGELRYIETQQPFFPLKYPWSLFPMAWHLKPVGMPYLGNNVTVDDAATISPDAVIEADAVIGPEAVIEGSLVGAGSHVDSRLPQSVLGADVHITAGVQIDSQTGGSVLATVKGEPLDTGLPELGTMIGQGAWIEVPATLGAGSLIGAEATVRTAIPTAGVVPDRTPAIEADA